MLSLVTCINGTYKVEAEGLSEQGAKVNFHQKCATLWNAPDVINARVAILDENLNAYNGYSENIYHAPQEVEE